jgi:hypothetical protein
LLVWRRNGIPRHHDETVFKCGRGNCGIKLFVAEPCCEPSPSAGNPDRQRQNAFAVSSQRKFQPICELLRKDGIEVLLTRDSKLNLADRVTTLRNKSAAFTSPN